jgi:hypothetical protein
MTDNSSFAYMPLARRWNWALVILISAIVIAAHGCTKTNENIHIRAWDTSAGSVMLAIKNEAPFALHDVNVFIETTNDAGERKAESKQFVGKWGPGETESFYYQRMPQKITVTIKARQGKRTFTIYELPFEG